MAASSTGTRKRTKRTPKTYEHKPEVKVTRIVQLFTVEHRTKKEPQERFRLTALDDGQVKVERESRSGYGGDDWYECDETYKFVIADLEAAIQLIKEDS